MPWHSHAVTAGMHAFAQLLQITAVHRAMDSGFCSPGKGVGNYPDLTSSRTHDPMKPSTGAAVRLHRNTQLVDHVRKLSKIGHCIPPKILEQTPRVLRSSAA